MSGSFSDLPRYPPEAPTGTPVRSGRLASRATFWCGLLVLIGALVGAAWLLGPALFLLFLFHPILLPVLFVFAVVVSGVVVLVAALAHGRRDQPE
jgi:hypothetical protein